MGETAQGLDQTAEAESDRVTPGFQFRYGVGTEESQFARVVEAFRRGF